MGRPQLSLNLFRLWASLFSSSRNKLSRNWESLSMYCACFCAKNDYSKKFTAVNWKQLDVSIVYLTFPFQVNILINIPFIFYNYTGTFVTIHSLLLFVGFHFVVSPPNTEPEMSRFSPNEIFQIFISCELACQENPSK